MASSSFPVGTAVKFWVPNLGARVPVDLSTGLPDYSEYVRSGLWVQRRRLRVCDGTGLTAYMPEGDRSWPSMLGCIVGKQGSRTLHPNLYKYISNPYALIYYTVGKIG